MPGATRRQLGTYLENNKLKGMNHTPFPRSSRDGGVLHSAASSADGETHFRYWNRDKNARASSHFYVDYDGEITQYIPLSHMSWTSVQGNGRTYGVETQGYPHEEWTKEQLESLAAIVKWTSSVENTPIRQMATTAKTERGIGHHQTPFGGELWNPNLHDCPGKKRIEQIPVVIEMTKDVSVTPTPTPAPKPLFSKTHIKTIQRHLQTLGYNLGSSGVDGLLGPMTTTAVISFQKKYGLEQDGLPGPLTLEKLKLVVSSLLDVDGSFGPASTKKLQQVLGTPVDGIISGQTRTNNDRLVAFQTVRIGVGGSTAIRALQLRLGVFADGHMGNQSIRAWQKKLGVTTDGYFGPISAKAAQEALNKNKLW